MDNQHICELRIQKKAIVKKLYATICIVLVTSILVATTSYAWLTLSLSTEVSNVTTTIGANGNLEIALGKNIGKSAVGDSFNKNDVTIANRTWGNLIDLTDESYGLQTITLRPAILNSAGGAINMLHPLAYPTYGTDGRVQYIYADNMFAGTYNGSQFVTSANDYGVHGIGTTQNHVPGVEVAFDPLSQRQESLYNAQDNLGTYTENTEHIPDNQVLADVYGYSIDLSFRTNADNSKLLLQTEAVDRIHNDGETYTDTSMGAGSYMEFEILDPSYTFEMAKEYMSYLRVVLTDTNTGYIYGYAALDMTAAEETGVAVKAPLRIYDMDTGLIIEGDTAQYICHLDKNLEKNLTVYVYLDGAKATQDLVSATRSQTLSGVMNIQFCSSADLKPALLDTHESGDVAVENTGHLTDNITWTLYSNGLLKFEGTGAMPDFSAVSDAPWYAHSKKISTVEISNGITYLGLANLASVDYAKITVPESVVAIVGHNGWGGRYKTVHYAGSIQQWNALALFGRNNTLVGGTILTAKSDAQILHSGSIASTNLYWTLTSDGILTVKGNGAMPDWTETYEAPWDQYKTSIKHIVISEGITYVGAYAFDGLSSVQSVKVASTVTKLSDYAFSDCGKLLAVAIGEDSSLLEIGAYCFNDCSSLKYVNIPDSVTTLGEGAFQACTVLDHVVINGVIELGNFVFYCCENLSSISFAKGVKVIPYTAFARNFKLTSISIPETVIRIEEYAFLEEHDDPCEVYYAGTSDQWDAISIGSNNMYFNNAEFYFSGVVVASGSVNDDITWSLDESGILVINGTGEIPHYKDGVGIYDQDIAEWINEDYHTVIISDGITSIGAYAFLWADNLTTVVLTTDVTNISQNAFIGCDLPITMYVIGNKYEFESVLNSSSFPNNITFEYIS